MTGITRFTQENIVNSFDFFDIVPSRACFYSDNQNRVVPCVCVCVCECVLIRFGDIPENDK